MIKMLSTMKSWIQTDHRARAIFLSWCMTRSRAEISITIDREENSTDIFLTNYFSAYIINSGYHDDLFSHLARYDEVWEIYDKHHDTYAWFGIFWFTLVNEIVSSIFSSRVSRRLCRHVSVTFFFIRWEVSAISCIEVLDDTCSWTPWDPETNISIKWSFTS